MESQDQTGESQIVNALMPFSEAHSTSLISVNRQIETDIDNGLEAEPKLWTALSPYLVASGKSGGRVWDHARVAIMLETSIPALRKYTNLTDHGVYDRFVAVIKRRGFIMVGGYIVGHTRDSAFEASDEFVEDENTAEAPAPAEAVGE